MEFISKLHLDEPLQENDYSMLQMLKTSLIDTPLGPMIAIANNKFLYLLEFTDQPQLERKIEQLKIKTNSAILAGKTSLIISIKKEIAAYFAGNLQTFTTPIHTTGTPFQKTVWQALTTITYGKTTSYREQARLIGNTSACRAVANANGANQLAIIIPCHRIIMSTGQLGGYAGGIKRKKWLLDHENHFISR